MDAIHPETLHSLCHDDAIVMTNHAVSRCQEREIAYDRIKEAILRGRIIEQYPTDYPYPSCLLVHTLPGNKPLHVVAGVSADRLWVVTAYYPDGGKWSGDYTTRMGGR
jgi:hypothetical protein